jgi:hypothetical protein
MTPLAECTAAASLERFALNPPLYEKPSFAVTSSSFHRRNDGIALKIGVDHEYNAKS